MLDDRNLPDVVVATPARAAADVLRFNDGGWRRGNFHPAVVHIRHVVFDEADALLSGGYLRAVRGCFDVLYREEKLAALGLTAPPASDDDADVASADSSDLGDVAADRDSADVTADPGWTGDAKRNDAAYEKDWRDDHDDVGGGGGGRDRDRRPRGYHRGPALGGKGLVGSGAGRDFRRQYVFAAATVMSNGKKTPGAIIRHGFPDARWVQGKRLHMAVERVTQEWISVDDRTRADALGTALGIPLAKRSDAPSADVDKTDADVSRRDRTMVFVNSSDACEAVAAEVSRQGLHRVASFHADVDASSRAARLAAFARGELDVLVCTDSAARGVDVPGVTHVVQAEFAGNAVDYLHRIGRTARAGAPGRVTNLYGEVNADLVAAVRDAARRGEGVESAFSRKRSFRKKYKKYGPSRTAPQNRK